MKSLKKEKLSMNGRLDEWLGREAKGTLETAETVFEHVVKFLSSSLTEDT